MGSNFSKNLVYDGCRLTRYDAHCGVVNGKIINSEIAMLTLTGGGNMEIVNTKFYMLGTLINMRSDYGCTWDGTITLKDCVALDPCDRGAPNFIVGVASANHWFGYPTSFPNIVIDNLKIEADKKSITFVNDYKPHPDVPYEFRSVCDPEIGNEGGICTDGKVNKNVYKAPEKIRVINNENNGYEIELYDVPFFKDSVTEGIKRIPYESN